MMKNASIALTVCLACGLLYLVLAPGAARERSDDTAFDDLSACAHLTSIDSRKWLDLDAGHVAKLAEMTGAGLQWATGTWALIDEDSQQYSIDVDGRHTRYTLVSAPEGEGCMLIKGQPDAADLPGSWFSALTDPK